MDKPLVVYTFSNIVYWHTRQSCIHNDKILMFSCQTQFESNYVIMLCMLVMSYDK